jgi:hypothetical protein
MDRDRPISLWGKVRGLDKDRKSRDSFILKGWFYLFFNPFYPLAYAFGAHFSTKLN